MEWLGRLRINPIAVVLSCACLMLAAAGLVSRTSATKAMPADAWAAPNAGAIAFYSEFLTLLTPPAREHPDRHADRQSADEAHGTSVRAVRMLRRRGSARVSSVEIEFVDAQGHVDLRRYPVEQATVGQRSSEAEPEADAASRRSRRTNGWRHRGFWPF